MTDSRPVPPEALTLAEASLVTSPLLAGINIAGWTRKIARIALEGGAETIRADERERLSERALRRIEPDPDAPGYNRAVYDLTAAEARIAELEQHVAVLEVRHAETDDAVRADERKRWLAAIECPSPCDDDCELRPDGCHEEHDVPSHRAHNPFQCSEIRLAIAAAITAEREHAAKVEADRAERRRLIGDDDWTDPDDQIGDDDD
jgi:hypothetical protein